MMPKIAFRPSSAMLALIGYILCALALRAFNFGNPVVHQDEQFYFLVGQRMLDGQLPYVDIWDRKPLGIFLIYAVIARIGGPGVAAYQWAACAFAVAGATLVRLIAIETMPGGTSHVTPVWRSGVWWAGVFYLVWLDVYNCSAGQTPVFYNPLVALAGLTALRLVKSTDTHALRRHGWVVMLLLGLALEIKPTVLFEGGGLAAAMLWRVHRRDPRPRLLLLALGWMAIAFTPTGLSLLRYAAIGHFHEIWQATFASSLLRGYEVTASFHRLLRQLALAIPIWFAVWQSWRVQRERANAGLPIPDHVVLLYQWAAACLGGFLLFGIYYDHYMAPLLVPFCALAAPALGLDRPERLRTLGLLAIGLITALLVTTQSLRDHGNAAQVDRATRLIDPQLGGGCLYIFEGPTILYHTTHACLASRFTFPDHLANALESRALGVDTATEMRAILTRRPRVIVTASQTLIRQTENRPAHAILVSGLANDYRRFAVVRIGKFDYVLYRRAN